MNVHCEPRAGFLLLTTAAGRVRSDNLHITGVLLCQLSYSGIIKILLYEYGKGNLIFIIL